MDFFHSYKIIQNKDTVELILYVNPNSTEFASELGEITEHKKESLQQIVNKYVKEKFPNMAVKSVKIMAGSLLFATLLMDTPKASAATDFNMGYLYFGSTDSFITQVDRTQGVINETAPSYFDLNADGTLKITSKMDKDNAFVKEMHKRGVKVVPFVSNHWDRDIGRAALANRELLSSQIAKAVIDNNLDGVNVDIENVSDIDRNNYTDFVRLLREKLPADKSVSVAVAANPNGWTKGWHGSYDYQKLAQYSDYLMIMAYDESWQGSEPGPVASISFAECSIKYALAQGVPSSKIVLGLPHYGRYWIEGQAAGGYGISNSRVEEIIKKYNGKVTFDVKSQSPKATVIIKEGDPATIINGKALAAGTYTIWYENAQSIKAKVDLVDQYNIKGTGSWSLGQENTALWSEFKEWIPKQAVDEGIPQQNLAEFPSSTLTTVNLRVAPSISAGIISTLEKSKPLKVLEKPITQEGHDWYKIQLQDGTEGYVAGNYINVVNRISGKNRFEVAVKISNQGWPEKADTVILTNYTAFADALAASPLAYQEDAPILLTHQDRLSDETKSELNRLKPKRIIIVGGAGSVGENVVKEVTNEGFSNIERIGGKNRYEVSYHIAQRLGNTSTAIVADGRNFPDALAIAPYAAKNGYPILLAKGNNLPDETMLALKEKQIQNTIVVGGDASVGNVVYNQLPSPQRISGKDRYEVAANVIRDLDLNPSSVYIATGTTFADALTGSVLAAKENASLVLTRQDKLPDSSLSILSERKMTKHKILGGTGSVGYSVVDQLRK
ncbi:cell wall-binding repeat-containing protein [Fredinandcohnia sp. FSL W7-1320]|uniref:cell wall-binding repeat-containing protein n=1 Tax=Fredinandcohnia sp. FSL W7-1320 TaxID=2954540 RepID=UPI0030FD56E6